MSIQKYPVGRQDFPSIIQGGFVYADKTMLAHELANLGGSYFLSKPRRFGKSLFLSTLESIFLGKKELFKSLYIYDKWQFEPYPIIKISFSSIGYRTMGLLDAIANELQLIAEKYDIKIKASKLDIANVHKELIESLSKKYQKEVVILIDEYDKPIIDYLDKDNLHKAIENRDILKTFYSILKDAEPYLKLLFITGVSKFSKVSIFSDLNNLTDLSASLTYHEICGISQKELEQYFSEELKVYDKEKIKEWYNGYKFHAKGETVYNPFSLLHFFNSKGDFKNYWYSTGTPTFLMKMCREQHLYKFDEISINQDDLANFDIENIKIIPTLFQTGYLTIKEEGFLNTYTLSFPNMEVKESYLRNLADAYINSPLISSTNILQDLLKSLKNNDKELMKTAINLAFSQIPYSLWQKENEQYYHAVIHLLFSLLGVYIQSEVHTQNGRADSIIHFENNIYCLEFKLDKTAEEAIEQINERGYLDKFQNSGQVLHKIGINFSSESKKTDGIIWEIVNGL